jgi:hypothetical protein
LSVRFCQEEKNNSLAFHVASTQSVGYAACRGGEAGAHAVPGAAEAAHGRPGDRQWRPPHLHPRPHTAQGRTEADIDIDDEHLDIDHCIAVSVLKSKTSYTGLRTVVK